MYLSIRYHSTVSGGIDTPVENPSYLLCSFTPVTISYNEEIRNHHRRHGCGNPLPSRGSRQSRIRGTRPIEGESRHLASNHPPYIIIARESIVGAEESRTKSNIHVDRHGLSAPAFGSQGSHGSNQRHPAHPRHRPTRGSLLRLPPRRHLLRHYQLHFRPRPIDAVRPVRGFPAMVVAVHDRGPVSELRRHPRSRTEEWRA